MKEKLLILFALVMLVAILVGLNALSYVQQEKLPDSEATPNRSTYNAGATGTRALHDLLVATGHDVIRWQQPINSEFESFDSGKFGTFVMIGPFIRGVSEEEIARLLAWTSAGGQLVLIDRDPPRDLLTSTASWEIKVDDGKNSISTSEKEYLIFSVDPANQSQMTARTAAVKPVQPTIFNAEVNGVQPSKFGTSVSVNRVPGSRDEDGDEEETGSRFSVGPGFGTGSGSGSGSESGSDTPATQLQGDSILQQDPPPPPPPPAIEENADMNPPVAEAESMAEPDLSGLAPVVHLANDDKNVLADFPFGAGRIVLLTDPYIVANGGIELADNSQAALNILASRRGPIAFDEYHHGFGADDNRLLTYFSGTPVVAILLQCAALVVLLLYSRGRRFARPLPADNPDRLSKLEYVSAMAQLQGRTKAFDLAIENVYTDFRRRVSRFFGVDNFTVSKESLGRLISDRLGVSSDEVVDLLNKCEDIMHGEPSKKSEVLALVKRIREIEDALGLERGRNAKHL
ncbi:MAG: DUF4350 domain-containing protein [Acidobacteria bacterium]|nr:MAG: DUF4350 domain-containing protein [Acidobacteriota bacterium]REK02837.1 MAG: DUF4350 domain-containing protein [Acidobacteriota bacterium]REK13359.1 MAG: DUF4350 domain-containing protein [Acidobacteriota bacterium]REK41353.1 MAG: DUF4350 domain-containing protein [Acidobacteriota bacterium]